MDIREKGKAAMDDVSVVWEYLDVFPKDFPRIPLERLVKFQIGLVPSVAPIAKTPNRLAPPEMQELPNTSIGAVRQGIY